MVSFNSAFLLCIGTLLLLTSLRPVLAETFVLTPIQVPSSYTVGNTIFSISSSGSTANACPPNSHGSSCPDPVGGASTCTSPYLATSGSLTTTVGPVGSYSACNGGNFQDLSLIGSTFQDTLTLEPTACTWNLVSTDGTSNSLTLQSSCSGSTVPVLTGVSSIPITQILITGIDTSTGDDIVVTPGSGLTVSCSGLDVTTVNSGHSCQYSGTGTTNYEIIATTTTSFTQFTVSGTGAHVSFSATQEQTLVVGDPQFVGLRGQSYQVHGIDGAIYNLISDATMQVNARFTFLRQGKCPTFAQTGGKVSPTTNCFSHPGSYIGTIAIQLVEDSRVIRMMAEAGSAALGFSSVAVDNEVIRVGQVAEIGSFYLNRTGTHTLTVSTPLFNFEFDSSDFFINQRLKVNVPLANLKTHGLIGQTGRRPSNPGSLKHIEGEIDDYVIVSEDLLGSDFVYNQFNRAAQ